MPDFLFHEFLEKNSIKSIGFRKNIMTNDRVKQYKLSKMR